MKTWPLDLAVVACALTACGPDLSPSPPLGDEVYRTALVCTDDAASAEGAADAVAAWNEASDGVVHMRVQLGFTDECVLGIVVEPIPKKNELAWSHPGYVSVDPSVRGSVNVLMHEFGHELTGGSHSPNEIDVMYHRYQPDAEGIKGLTENDVKRLEK